eukprot:gene801-biopygen8454
MMKHDEARCTISSFVHIGAMSRGERRAASRRVAPARIAVPPPRTRCSPPRPARPRPVHGGARVPLEVLLEQDADLLVVLLRHLPQSLAYGGVAAARGAGRVAAVVADATAFVAVRSDGSLVAWGHEDHGGALSRLPPQGVRGTPLAAAGGVAEVAATKRSFAALLWDGTYAGAWGDPAAGGGAGSATGMRLGVAALFATRAQ